MQTQAVSSAVVKPSPRSRSRITNGKGLFAWREVDHRSAEARRFRDVLGEIASDLGGLDQMSEGQKQLARRCALLSVECEKLEARSVSGEPFDIEIYGKLCDRLGRAFQRLGLRRVAKAGPSLAEYLAGKRPKAPTLEASAA